MANSVPATSVPSSAPAANHTLEVTQQVSTSPITVAICSWLMPGLGYWLIGERVRGWIAGICIILLFLGGLLIGGVRVVQAPAALSTNALLDKPWFVPQVLTGPVAVVSAVAAARVPPSRDSTSRSNEIGMLYAAIAGMLNLLVLMDAAYRCAKSSPPADPVSADPRP